MKVVAASLASVALLVTLVLWRPDGIMAVILALLCVLLGVVAGVAVTSAREAGWAEAAAAHQPGQLDPQSYELDADTLEVDTRAVRTIRAVNGVSDR